MFMTIACWTVYLYQVISMKMSISKYTRLLRNSSNISSMVVHQRISGEKFNISGLVEKSLEARRGKDMMFVQNRLISEVQPMYKVDLRNWTSFLDSQNYPSQPVAHGSEICYILLEAGTPDDQSNFLQQTFSVPDAKRVKLADYVTPIAWRSGTPFGIVAECSIQNLARLVMAYLEGTVFMEDMLQVLSISTVELEGHALNLLRLDSAQGSLRSTNSFAKVPFASSSADVTQSTWPPSFDDNSGLNSESYKGSNESLAYASSGDNLNEGSPERMIMDHQFNAANEYSDADCIGEYECAAGEAPSESVAELAPEVLTPLRRHGTGNQGKPPNVLIYCGKKDATRNFNAVSSVIQLCLHPDKYVVYHLKHDDVHTAPWQDNTLLLIIASEKVYDGVDECFLDYFHRGGLVISFGSMFDKVFAEKSQISTNLGIQTLDYMKWKDFCAICGRYVYDFSHSLLPGISLESLAADSNTKKSLVLEATHDTSSGIAILSQIHLDKDPSEMAIRPEVFTQLKQANPLRFSILKDWLERLGLDCSDAASHSLTPIYLQSSAPGKMARLMKAIEGRMSKDKQLKSGDVMMKFMGRGCEQEALDSEVKVDCIPVLTSKVPSESFNTEEYFHNLKTQTLGQVLFYTDVVTSTMSIFDGWMFCLPPDTGVIAVAKHQLKGQGRGGNAWLSPAGCAMFSAHVSIPLNSSLGQRVAYVQHIASLAIVMAVRNQPGYENLEVRIKWPNDIYFGSTMKLGGVLVKSSIMVNNIHCNIGCGFNVSNKNPTVCINDLVQQYNIQNSTHLQPFTIEHLLASTITHMESLIKLFQTEGKQAFLELYYDKWLHSDAPVTIQQPDETQAEVKITGLDDFGYLAIESPDGSTQSVHPDGNSFDMMRNLIVPKMR